MKVLLNVNDDRWNAQKIDFAHVVNVAVSKIAKKYKNPVISITLINDSEMQKLNKQYRGINKPTNVLSFETGDSELLGDIFISFDTVKAEAISQKKSFTDHVTHMAVHGVLHLMGYDHITDSDADIMESLEIEILKNLKIKNPYQDVYKSCGVNFLHRPWVEKCGLFLLGILTSLGFAPFNQWWVSIISIGLVYLLFNSIMKKRSVRMKSRVTRFFNGWIFGAIFGSGYAVSMFWWVLNSIFVVPELTAQFAIWTVPGIAGIAIAGGAIFGLPFALMGFSKIDEPSRPIVFACAWTLVLWAREWMFTGFPWNPFSNVMLSNATIANSMSLWGALGLTFVSIGLSAAVADWALHKKNPASKKFRGSVLIFLSLSIVGMFAGYINLAVTKKTQTDPIAPTFRIVQPATSQADKATHDRDAVIDRLHKNMENLIAQSMSGESIPDIIIWPETAYPYYVAGDDFPASREIGRIVIAGATVVENGNIFNSMVIADPSGKIKRIYSKSHLVPFGEYSPMGILPSPANLSVGSGPEVINISHILPVSNSEEIMSSWNIKFAPAICYEIVFSDSLLPKGQSADMIINITNDTWFGDTPGTYQHLDMARRYAIESGMPIIRANYSGISAFISADGRVLSSLPVGISGILDGQISAPHKTPYLRIGRNWTMVIILIISCIGICLVRKKD